MRGDNKGRGHVADKMASNGGTSDLSGSINRVLGLPAAEASLISTKEEIDIGRMWPWIGKTIWSGGRCALQDRVARIGASLVAVSDRKDLPYTLKC